MKQIDATVPLKSGFVKVNINLNNSVGSANIVLPATAILKLPYEYEITTIDERDSKGEEEITLCPGKHIITFLVNDM